MIKHLHVPVVINLKTSRNGLCIENSDGWICGEGVSHPIHDLDQPPFFSGYPEIEVRITRGGVLGVHLCQVAWDRITHPRFEHIPWFAAWFSPHNQPNRWYRAPRLDAHNEARVGYLAGTLLYRTLRDEYTDGELKEMGLSHSAPTD